MQFSSVKYIHIAIHPSAKLFAFCKTEALYPLNTSSASTQPLAPTIPLSDSKVPPYPSMGFSRQEYWSGLPFPSPGDLPDPGIEPGSPSLEADTLTSEPPGKMNITVIQVYAPTSNDKEAEVEWFYEDLQDLLELTPKKDVLFTIRGLECKSRKSRNTWSNRQIWPWSTK